jgi:ferredoxin
MRSSVARSPEKVRDPAQIVSFLLSLQIFFILTQILNRDMKLYGYLGLVSLVAGFGPTLIMHSSTTRSTRLQMMPSLVDLDQYNLPIDEIAQEWTATLQAATALTEEGVYLGAKSSTTIFVDSVKVEFTRGPGLGIELLEIAGGRDDGLGITVVSGLVEGGSAEGSGIQIGDSIVKIAVDRRASQVLVGGAEEQLNTEFLDEMAAVETECLGYDVTVEAIGSLPPKQDGDVMVLTLKRLRRKPRVTVTLQFPPSQNQPDTTIELFSGENLRRAMLTRGVPLNDPLSKRFDSGGTGSCGGEATCTTCVVGIMKGAELVNKMGIQEKQILIKNPRWRLACKAIVGHGMQEGEMTIRVNPRQWND